MAISRKRRFRLPWQDTHKLLPEDKAAEALRKGKELFVEGPQDFERLPLKSVEDLQEFRVFHGSEAAKKLPEPELASELQELNDRGFSYLGLKGEERTRIGAYGAYNYLTGDLTTHQALGLSFSQKVPAIAVESKSTLGKLTQRVKEIDGYISSAPEEFRENHRKRLLKTSADNLDLRLPELVKLASERFITEDWLRGEMGSFLTPSLNDSPHQRAAAKILEAGPDTGLRQARSALALYRASLDGKLETSEFIAQVKSDALTSDKEILEENLGRELFPAKWSDTEHMVAHLEPEEKRAATRSKLFLAAMREPKSLPKLELVEKALTNLAEDEEELAAPLYSAGLVAKGTKQARALAAVLNSAAADYERDFLRELYQKLLSDSLDSKEVQKTLRREVDSWEQRMVLGQYLTPELYPEKVSKIESWLAKAPDKQKERMRRDLMVVALEQPELTSPEEHLSHLSKLVPGLERSNQVYKAVLSSDSIPKHTHAGKITELCDSKDKWGHPILSAATQALLLQAASRAGLTDEELLSLAASVHGKTSERIIIAEVLGPVLLPEKEQLIESWLEKAPEDKKGKYLAHLMMSALQDPEAFSAQVGLTQVYESLGSEDANALSKVVLTAESVAKNKHADIILDLCDSKNGSGRFHLSAVTQGKLLKVAAKPKLKDEDLIEVASSAHYNSSERAHIVDRLGPILLPEKTRRIENWVKQAPPKKVAEYKSALLMAAFNAPDASSSQDFLKAIRGTFTAKKANFLSRLVLRADKANKTVNTDRILEICDPESRLYLSDEAQSKLLLAAADPDLTDEKFFEVARSVRDIWPDRSSIASHIVPAILPEIAKNIERWVAESPAKVKGKCRDNLMVACLENPKISSAFELLNQVHETLPVDHANLASKAVLASPSVPKNNYTGKLLELCQSKSKWSTTKISAKTQASLLQAAANPKLTGEKLLDTLENIEANQDELITIARKLGNELLPKRSELFTGWLENTPEEKRVEYKDQLLAAALRAPKASSAQEHLKQAYELFSTDDAIELAKVVLNSNNVAKNSHANRLLKLSTLQNERSRNKLSQKAQVNLLRLAANPTLTDQELQNALRKAGDRWKDRVLIAEEFGPVFFPEKLQRINQWLELAPKETREELRQHFLITALEKPELDTPSEFLGELSGRIKRNNNHATLNEVYQVLIEADLANWSPSHQALVRACALKKEGGLAIHTLETRLKLFEFAVSSQKKPFSSKSEFLKAALDSVRESQRTSVSAALGFSLLEELKESDSIRQDVLHEKLSTEEILVILDSAVTESQKSAAPVNELLIEDELIVVGDEILEVDL